MPTKSQDRIPLIDVIRGFAVFGIILVNAPSINSSIWNVAEFGFQITAWDAFVSQFIMLFAAGKFYPIFSFLFGWGIMAFIESAERKQQNPAKLFIRRMNALLFLGLLNISLVWYGDVLLTYAIVGSLAFFFHTYSKQKLLSTIAWLLAILLIYHFYSTVIYLSEDFEYEEIDMQMLYQTGTFVQIFWLRLQDYYELYLWGFFDLEYIVSWTIYIVCYLLHMVSLFLLGIWTYKQRLFHDIDANWHMIKPIGISCLIFGLGSSSLSLHSAFFDVFLYPVSGISLGLGYIFLLISAYKHQLGKRLLSLLAYAGRMSLTNYMSSNIILTVLFYGYGFGLYGTMGAGSQLWITLAVCSVIALFSYQWLQHFQRGPLESLWYKYTYAQQS